MLFGGGWMWTAQKDAGADWPAGNQAGSFLFCLFPSLLSSTFSPFLEASATEEQRWSINNAKEGSEGTIEVLGKVGEQNTASILWHAGSLCFAN